MVGRDHPSRHLHNQIVLPLIAAALVIGVVATLVAVTLLSNLTRTWVRHSALAAVDNMDARLEAAMNDMQQAVALVGATQRIKERLTTEDPGSTTAFLAALNSDIGADSLIALDEEGRVVGATGRRLVFEYGSMPLGERQRVYAALNMAHPIFVSLNGSETLTALQGLDVEGDTFVIALSEIVDDGFLAGIADGIPASFCFYTANHELVACSVHPADTRECPSLAKAMRGNSPELLKAVDAANDDRFGESMLRLPEGDFAVVAKEVRLTGDPTYATRHIVAEVSTQLSDDASAYTTRLILLWSLVAVAALIGLGVWVARSVSEPLAELSEGARRVAEGDFDTRVEAIGANEVAELAGSFNQMTDSLKQRTEALTKKVLELATLYEMSRSLGSTLELDRLLESVLDSALRIFDVDLGYVTLRDPESERLELKVRRGSGPGRPDERAIRSSMSEWVMREGRPLVFNPDPDAEPQHQVDSVTGALAALCVPLFSGEGVIGAVTVGSHDPCIRFSNDDVRLLSTIANHVSIAIGNIELFSSLQDAYLSTVRSLAAAVDAKDSYTRGHSDSVAYYATVIADRVGLSTEQKTALEMAAYLHDIGKIGVREEILLKPGRLSEEETAQMRHHPLIGANILKPVGFPWPITPVVRHHHERWDGKGYPAGLKGEEIPLLARILAVADAFEAMTSDRPYRPGRSREEAVEEVRRCTGSQFDPRIAEAFVSFLEDSGAHDGVSEPGGQLEAEPDEVRAIFVAICDGMFDGFRRLGGPRLSTNLETELNELYREGSLPFIMSGGHMSVWFDDSLSFDEEVRMMGEALAVFGQAMERSSGHGLVEHFYSEALMDLSERMRRLARDLSLRPAS